MDKHLGNEKPENTGMAKENLPDFYIHEDAELPVNKLWKLLFYTFEKQILCLQNDEGKTLQIPRFMAGVFEPYYQKNNRNFEPTTKIRQIITELALSGNILASMIFDEEKWILPCPVCGKQPYLKTTSNAFYSAMSCESLICDCGERKDFLFMNEKNIPMVQKKLIAKWNEESLERTWSFTPEKFTITPNVWLPYTKDMPMHGDAYVYDSRSGKVYEFPHGSLIEPLWNITHIMYLVVCPICGTPAYVNYSNCYKDECECSSCAHQFIVMKNEVSPP